MLISVSFLRVAVLWNEDCIGIYFIFLPENRIQGYHRRDHFRTAERRGGVSEDL